MTQPKNTRNSSKRSSGRAVEQPRQVQGKKQRVVRKERTESDRNDDETQAASAIIAMGSPPRARNQVASLKDSEMESSLSSGEGVSDKNGTMLFSNTGDLSLIHI